MVSRRSSLVALTAGLGLLSVGGQALAGAQLEEPLADSVRGALTASMHVILAPPSSLQAGMKVRPRISQREEYQP